MVKKAVVRVNALVHMVCRAKDPRVGVARDRKKARLLEPRVAAMLQVGERRFCIGDDLAPVAPREREEVGLVPIVASTVADVGVTVVFARVQYVKEDFVRGGMFQNLADRASSGLWNVNEPYDGALCKLSLPNVEASARRLLGLPSRRRQR
jgi:hypothetical protein